MELNIKPIQILIYYLPYIFLKGSKILTILLSPPSCLPISFPSK